MKPKISDIIIDKNKIKLDNRDFCGSCHELATKLIKYQVGDREQKVTRIERYCLRHFELIIKK
jgi:hypothetical protein